MGGLGSRRDPGVGEVEPVCLIPTAMLRHVEVEHVFECVQQDLDAEDDEPEVTAEM